jgi:hypothetical protein
MKALKRQFFVLLGKLNKAILPKAHKMDLDNLSKFDKAVIGYKYWVTKNALKDSQDKN